MKQKLLKQNLICIASKYDHINQYTFTQNNSIHINQKRLINISLQYIKIRLRKGIETIYMDIWSVELFTTYVILTK